MHCQQYYTLNLLKLLNISQNAKVVSFVSFSLSCICSPFNTQWWKMQLQEI